MYVYVYVCMYVCIIISILTVCTILPPRLFSSFPVPDKNDPCMV